MRRRRRLRLIRRMVAAGWLQRMMRVLGFCYLQTIVVVVVEIMYSLNQTFGRTSTLFSANLNYLADSDEVLLFPLFIEVFRAGLMMRMMRRRRRITMIGIVLCDKIREQRSSKCTMVKYNLEVNLNWKNKKRG